jgi:hypothetical protein
VSGKVAPGCSIAWDGVADAFEIEGHELDELQWASRHSAYRWHCRCNADGLALGSALTDALVPKDTDDRLNEEFSAVVAHRDHACKTASRERARQRRMESRYIRERSSRA